MTMLMGIGVFVSMDPSDTALVSSHQIPNKTRHFFEGSEREWGWVTTLVT